MKKLQLSKFQFSSRNFQIKVDMYVVADRNFWQCLDDSKMDMDTGPKSQNRKSREKDSHTRESTAAKVWQCLHEIQKTDIVLNFLNRVQVSREMLADIPKHPSSKRRKVSDTLISHVMFGR